MSISLYFVFVFRGGSGGLEIRHKIQDPVIMRCL